MKTHFFKVVQTVAQHGSFSEAAAILGCSQSNISYAIKEVEDFFEKRLFIRSRTGCTLTPEGQGHQPDPRKHHGQTRTTKKNGVSGSVTIHYHSHILETSLSASLDFLAHHYPDIHLNVLHRSEQHPSLDALIKEVADILILPGTVLNEHYLEHHCWSDHYVLVAARSKQAT